MSRQAPELVLDESSPHGNLHATLERDDRVVYLYLTTANSEQPVRACWVRNLRPAPQSLDVAAMERGEAPMLPRAQCAHPEGAGLPNPERLRFIWFEEGDGVALVEGDDVLAIIPVWPGVDFTGYARDCTIASTLCWPLLPDNTFRQHVSKSEDYWRWWESHPWSTFQPRALGALEAKLGKALRYFAIDGGEWPPKAAVLAEGAVTTIVTLGVALRGQPAIDAEDATTPRRIELAFAVGHGSVEPLAAVSYISAQANLPWAHHTYLATGHTIPCDLFKSTKFEFVLLHNQPPGVPTVEFDTVRGERVDVLWMIPITAAERKFAEESGSAELAHKLWKADVTGVFRKRRDIVKPNLLRFFGRR